MTPSAILSELASRCEAGSGADRELFLAVAKVVPEKFGIVPDAWCHTDGSFWWANGKKWGAIPDFYASLDAALALVPEGWDGSIYLATDTHKPAVQLETPAMRAKFSMDYEGVTSEAATPALALTAAALRALASQAGETR